MARFDARGEIGFLIRIFPGRWKYKQAQTHREYVVLPVTRNLSGGRWVDTWCSTDTRFAGGGWRKAQFLSRLLTGK